MRNLKKRRLSTSSIANYVGKKLGQQTPGNSKRRSSSQCNETCDLGDVSFEFTKTVEDSKPEQTVIHEDKGDSKVCVKEESPTTQPNAVWEHDTSTLHIRNVDGNNELIVKIPLQQSFSSKSDLYTLILMPIILVGLWFLI